MIQQNKNKIKEEWTLPVLTPYTGILDDLGGVTTRFKLQASPTHSSHHLHPPPITHILLPSPTSSSHHPHPPPITHTLLFLLSCTVLVFYYHSVTSSCTFHYKISSPLHSLHSLHSSLIHQVFFAVVVGAMYLGQSSPNLQSLATAASANGPLCETIDRVSAQP